MGLPLAALAAAAAALYPKDAEAAKFSWMSPERLRQLVANNSYIRGDKTKGGLTMMRPSEFLATTTPTTEFKDQLIRESGRFDPFRFQKESQHPFLYLNSIGEVAGHEGRHRLAGLQQAAGDIPVPVVINPQYERGLPPSEISNWSNRRFQGQLYGPGRGRPVDLNEVEPFTYENNLDRYLQEVEVPLKNVGIALKPEGPGFTREDKRAYHEYIPYGKIPPPIPAFKHPMDVFKPHQYRELVEEWSQMPRDERPPMFEWMQQFYPTEAKK